MAPPAFKKVSKSADDLFNDDFGASKNRVTFKSKTSTGVNLKLQACRSTGPLNGLIETKWTAKCGVDVTEKWTTANLVTTELGLNDKLLKNSDVTLTADISPATHMLNNWGVKSKYSSDSFITNVDVSPKAVGVAGVFSFKQYLLGASVNTPLDFSAFNTSVTGSYSTGGLVIATSVKDSGDVQGSVFNKCCDDFSVGAQFGWERATSAINFGLAGNYKIDNDCTFKAKADMGFNLNFSIIQKLSNNVTARFSADVPAKGDTALGVDLTINA
jgi:hypothetical protein